jgi:hypothetical protein
MTLTRQLHRGAPAMRGIRMTIGPSMAFLASLAGGIAQAIKEHSFL